VAAARYRESLELRWKWGERRGVAESLAGVAELCELTGRHETSARLFGGIDTLRQAIGVPGYRWEQARRDQALTHARLQLGASVFQAAFADGQAMAPSEVVSLALLACRELEKGDPAVADPADVETESGERLTVRELEVLRSLAGGLSDREIGDVLFISPRTVARHLHSIYQKLGVNSRSAATAYAHKQGLV
jgi:DNA-binding NarL/FixJ family response regulator